MVDIVDKVIIEYESKNFDKTAGDVKQLTGNLSGLTEVSFTTEKSTASVENRFASLERRFQTTAAQSAQYEKIQKDVNLAVAQNPALQDRANEILKAAEARYLGAGVAVKELANAHKGLDAQGQAALHSVRSVVEQLALGIPPTQALTGQLNHLTFAATGEGGLAGAFKQVGGLIGGLLTPTTAAIAGTVALTAAAAALAVQRDKVQTSSQRALIGAGDRTGTTVSDLNQFTQQNSGGISGTGLSNKEARALGEDFTKTGEIVISRLHGMSDAVVGFANQTGKSIDEARKDIVGFAVEPQKGLDELSKTYGSFDIATRKAVEALALAGDKTGAFQVVVDNADKALIPQIAQLEQLRIKIEELERAKAAGVTSRYGADVDNAALQAGQNQASALRESQAEAANYNQRVQEISQSWGDVTQKTALQLQQMQNQLPVAQASTGEAQMRAQYEATIVDLLMKGVPLLDAQAIASKGLELSQAQANASVEKQVRSLERSTELMRAEANGQGARVTANQAYDKAMEDGADSAHAAALSTAALANYLERAKGNAAQMAKAAQATADSYQRAANAALEARAGVPPPQNGDFGAGNSQVTSQFGNIVGPALASTSNLGVLIAQSYQWGKGASNQPSVSQSADSILGGAGLNAAISSTQALQARNAGQVLAPGNVPFSQYGLPDIVTPARSESDILSTVSTLYDLKNAQTNDKASKISNLNEELAWLNTRPETIARDQQIASLMNSINQLAKATDSNTAAVLATLNPLYTQGHGALAIGYYHAAAGLDVIANGPSSGDTIPFRAMVNGGERIRITPEGQSGNDNTPIIIQNFDFRGADAVNNARRSRRQFAQGFGQTAAAMSR